MLRDGRTDTVENAQGYPVCTVHWHPNEWYDHGTRAAYIAACDPDTIREMLAERDALSAEVAEWKARADDLAAALNKCIKLAYNRDLDELPSAIITTATKAVAKYDMLVDFSATLDD